MRKLKLNELGRVSLEAYKAKKKHPIVFVLDNIRSHHNVGSSFRTADALGIEKLILSGITPKPPHREIQKTALGATLSVEWLYEASIQDSLKQLKDEGYLIIAVEQTDSSVMLNDYQPSQDDKIALVFGNEVNGVTDEALKLADIALEIPQYGTKHSFNISVSLGIVGWDLLQKIKLL